MAENTVKDMTTNFGKLDKFEGHDFRRWQKKMHFLLTTLKLVYVLTTPMPKLLKDATVEAIRIRAKWEYDDYICRGHILNGMSYSLFDVYTNVESAKELWDSLEFKYMAEDSSSKKFLDVAEVLVDFRTRSLVPLHNPFGLSICLNNIIRTPTFNASMWFGTHENFNPLINSGEKID
nr:zinc finger, CCHC-type [Tanacetum cinerariifolium]